MTASGVVRVSAVQLGPSCDDLGRNARAVASAVVAAVDAGAEIVVFPELAATPFFAAEVPAHVEGWAQPLDGTLVTEVAAVTATREVLVVLPFFEFDRVTQARFNAAILIGPEGPVPVVDRHGVEHPTVRKVHLAPGPEGDEREHFAPGDALGVAEIGDVRLGVLICYDRRFPECWRELRALEADAVAVAVAGQGGDDVDFFLGELRTHARENGVAVIAANKVGLETLPGGTVRHFGESCVVDAEGTVIARRAGPDGPGVVVADLDFDEQARVRGRFPYFDVRRTDLYGIEWGEREIPA